MIKTFYAKNRTAWRAWLKKNYKTQKEVWLVYPHKSTCKPRVGYNDAVEEALCFGWIDSQVRNIGPDSAAQRFSPRNPKTTYSQANIERLNALYKEGKLMPEVKTGIKGIILARFKFPDDIIEELRKDKTVWKNYSKYPAAYKRIRVAFINGARNRPAEFEKRMAYLIKMTKQNKMFGFGGVDKYFV